MGIHKKLVGVFCGVGALLATSLSASASDLAVNFFSDSGFDGPEYPVLVQSLKNLAEKNPDLAEVFTYGMTPGGLPMTGIRIRSIKNPGADAPLMVINGAIHGDEYLGIEDRFPEWFLTQGLGIASIQKFLASGGEIVFIPVMNPDGYTADQRWNSTGADLNRDFELKRTGHAASEEVETKAYDAFLRNEILTTGRKLRFTMDYHCCLGAMLVPWSYGKRVPMEPRNVQRYSIMRTLAKDILGVKAGTPWEMLGYTADGSTMDHFFEAYDNVAVAYEGEYRTEYQYFDKHASFLERTIEALNEGRLQ